VKIKSESHAMFAKSHETEDPQMVLTVGQVVGPACKLYRGNLQRIYGPVATLCRIAFTAPSGNFWLAPHVSPYLRKVQTACSITLCLKKYSIARNQNTKSTNCQTRFFLFKILGQL